MSFRSHLIGFIAGGFIALTGVAMFSNKIHASAAIILLPLAILTTIMTWRSIKKDEAESF